EEGAPPLTWALAAELENADAVHADIKGWREQGSDIEDIVESVFDVLGKTIAVAAEDDGTSAPMLPNLSNLRPHVASTAAIRGLDDYLGGFTPPATRAGVLHGERLEATGQPAVARANYVWALTTEPLPNVGVMWRLGNLARHAGHRAEAALWFRLSLAYDAI